MAIVAVISTKPLRALSPSSFPFLKTPKFPSQYPSHPTVYSPKSTNASTLTTAFNTTKSRLVLRASASDFGSYIGESLGDVTIFTAAGEPVMIKDLWDQNEGIAVVALLRHFGCPCCWELASVLKESKSKFESAGVKLIAIGVGAPNKARILADRAYDVLGLYYGFGRTFFNPASAKVFSRFDALQKAVKNYTIEATPDDRSGVLQQGGMFVFKGKQLLYARKDEGTGDHAPLDDVFNICCKVPIA
ncbi:prostamide/prostaglandin F synthase isoform X2 [Jatropha curcas]|uniref:prostamide/prostaglandin F synthase isoform X2 n=1 Tax=Jatropha curcas TaxID=180498 RepID=UPI0005FB8AC8|nr:prostamide/prostaglandin F synthase isoform X2 [Jatropha curcas]